MTQTGRLRLDRWPRLKQGCLRLEHRQGWLDAVMAECPCSQDSNRTFEIRATPRMASRRDGEKGPLPRLKQGCLRLEHRHGWLDAVMAKRRDG